MHLGRYLTSLILVLPAGAAEPVTPDFGPGLAKIAALGLPEMKGATWIKPPKDAGEGYEGSYELRELGMKFQGGAWKTPGNPPRIIRFATGETLAPGDEAEDEPAAPAGAPGLLEKMLRKHAESQPPKEAKPKAGPSLDEDVKQLVEILAKPEAAEEMAEQAEYGRADLPGRLLIFAAQIHAAGQPEAANKVAAAVFAAIPDKTAVIDAAIHHFAESDYQILATAFFENRDWKAYHAGLKSMLEKYPRGWADATAVSILLPGVEKRAAGTLPAPPSLEGIGLKPEALAAVAALLDPPPADPGGDEALAEREGIDLSRFPAAQRGMILAQLRARAGSGEFNGGLWLLQDDDGEDGEENEEGAEPAGPAGSLVALGMDGLIALAAVATDDTLTFVRNSPDGGGYYSSSQSAEEIALSRFEDLDRPRTRGEIARELLAAVVPASEDEDNEDLDPQTLQERAIEFWKANRAKSPLELARVYLTEGDDSQRQLASYHLAASDDPAARGVFEKAVLESESPVDFASTVENYLERHKADAKPFFDAYSKLLTEAFEGIDPRQMGYSSGAYALREAGGVEKYLKTLSMKVGAVSLKELLADAMKTGEVSDIASLRPALQSAGPLDSLIAVGEVAGKATPDQLAQLCLILLQGAYREYDPEDEDQPPPIPLPAEMLDLWRPLLGKTDPLPEAASFGSWATSYGAKTTGDGVALVLEVCAFPASGSQFNGYGDINGSLATVGPFVRTRVEAWINGKDAPPWPDESKVSDARKEEITGQLAKLPAMEIPAFAMALPLDERRALASLVEHFDEETPPPATLLELRTRVVARRAFNPRMTHDDALLDQLGIADGHRFDAASLAALAERMAKESATLSGVQVTFYAAPMGLGSVATATRVTKPEEFAGGRSFVLARWFQQFPDQDALAMLAIENSANFWGLKDGAVTPLEAPRPADEALKEAFESKSIELPYISLQVITRADADKLNQEDE
jgi:hypothetical protein